MDTYQKLKAIWKKLGIKAHVKKFSSKTLWVIETDSGPAKAHLLLPMRKSPSEIDIDGFRREDGIAIDGHLSWWKIYDVSTAEVFDDGDRLKISVITRTKVFDQEFTRDKVLYDPAKNWGETIRLVSDVRRDKKKRIIQYYVSGLGWINPDRALKMTCHGELDNARPVFPKDGDPYIRTRRDQKFFNNLSSKGLA